MTSLFDIRDKAQRAEGQQPEGVQFQVKDIPEATQKLTTQSVIQTGNAAALPAARRALPPFTGIEDSRNYRAMYRSVCDFHERHNPPCLTLEYWEKAADDLSATASLFDNDPFVNAMLIAVYDELEREYKKLEATQTANNTDSPKTRPEAF